MDENVVHRLKASGDEYYDKTRKGIRAKMKSEQPVQCLSYGSL